MTEKSKEIKKFRPVLREIAKVAKQHGTTPQKMIDGARKFFEHAAKTPKKQ